MQSDLNYFFTKEVYDTEIRLDLNVDILKRIYNDGVTANDELPIEFVFITDTKDKAIHLKESISKTYPTYTNIEVDETDDYWEINGVTFPIRMSINEINHWNKQMWDLGYQYDCQLDGWMVGT